MGTPAQSLPPWQQAAAELPPWEQAKQDAAKAAVAPGASAAGGSWTPNVGQEIEQSKLGQAHPTLAKIAGVTANTGAGVLKGAGQLLGGLDNTAVGRWVNSYGGLRSPAATQADTDAYKRLTTPHGTAQKIGYGAEKAGEFLLPELGGISDIGKVGEGASLGEKLIGTGKAALAQGVANAGISKLQGGSAKTGAEWGAALPIAGAALSPVAKIAEERVAPAIYNSIIRPSIRDLESGADPGGEVAKLGTGAVAMTRRGLAEKIGTALQGANDEQSAILRSPQNAQNVIRLAQPIQDAFESELDRAAGGGNRNPDPELYDDLLNERKRLMMQWKRTPDGLIPNGPRALNLSPADATEIKTGFGKTINWRTADQRAVNLNNAMRRVYGAGLMAPIEDAVPEVGPVNRKIGNLLAADRAMDRTLAIRARGSLPLGSMLESGTSGAIGAGVGGVPGAAIGLLGSGIAHSTPVATVAAQALRNLGPIAGGTGKAIRAATLAALAAGKRTHE